MDNLPTEIICQIVGEVADLPCNDYNCSPAPSEGRELVQCAHRQGNLAALCRSSRALYAASIERLYGSPDIGTYELRCFLRTMIENRRLASMVREVTCGWEEYLEIDWRLPTTGEIRLPQDFQALFENTALQSGYEWSTKALTELGVGSSDAEGTLLIQVLPELTVLNIDFPTRDDEQEWSYSEPERQGIFRQEILCDFFNRQDYYPLSEIDVGKHQPLAKLQRIRVSNPYDLPWTVKSGYPPNVFWHLGQLSGLFFLDQLSSLSISRCDIWTAWDNAKLYKKIIGSSNLEDISIFSALAEPKALSEILSFPRELKKFVFEAARPSHLLDLGYDTPEFFSPRLLLAGLQQHKQSLESLVIKTACDDHNFNTFDEYGMHFNVIQFGEEGAHETTIERWRQLQSRLIQPIDLHYFTALKHVSANVKDLLGPEVLYNPEAYRGLVDILPPNLETLVLTHHDYNEKYRPHDQCPQYSIHIVEVLNSTNEKLRKLRKIEMQIDKSWEPPEESVKQLATAKGVKLIVRLVVE